MGLREGHKVELHVLAGGHVALLQGSVVPGNGAKRLKLLGEDLTHRQLHPEHVHVRLALPVDAHAQAEGLERGRVPVALDELANHRLEVVQLFLQDGKDALFVYSCLGHDASLGVRLRCGIAPETSRPSGRS